MAGAVLASRDGMEVGLRRGRLCHEIVQSCGRGYGGDGFEEGAALEGHWLMVRAKFAAGKGEFLAISERDGFYFGWEMKWPS